MIIKSRNSLFAAALLTALGLSACATQPAADRTAAVAAQPTTTSDVRAASATPTPPYYSVQLASFKTEKKAQEVFTAVNGEPFTRAERRGDWLGIRIGAWDSAAAAREALQRYKGQFDDAFVLRCTTQPSFITPG